MKKTMNKTTKNNFINYGIVIAIFVIVEILSGTGNLSRLLTGLLVPLCVYTIAAISLNLVVGFSGELSLGHAGFMCVGAYSSALFSHIASDIPQVPRFILAILIGAAVAAVFGVIIGIPVLRLRGDYLAIVTLAFGEIIKNLINILYVGFDENGLHVATSSANLKLAAGGKQILKGALGISGTGVSEEAAQTYGIPSGVFVSQVTEGGAAEQAGITANSIITAFDGKMVTDISELKSRLEYYKAGEQIEVTLQVPDNNGYTEKTVTVTLGKADSSTSGSQQSGDDNSQNQDNNGGFNDTTDDYFRFSSRAKNFS